MKHLSASLRKIMFWLLLSVILSILAACGRKEPEMKRYASDDSVSELLSVRRLRTGKAIARFYVKENGKWHLVTSGKAYVGRNGLGKTKEGDGRSPKGEFRVVGAFGVLPNPGTTLEYLNITPTTFACDEEGEFYNRIIDTSKVHHDCKGEDMFHTVPAYNYGLEIDFNPENIYPLGSNIFVHCFSGKPYTAGCVALKEEMMKRIIISAHKGMVVSIK